MSLGKHTTITQVAREAGVSTQTVSRVLNDRPDVAPQTRQLVQSVIDRLGYQPSALARSLKQRSRTIGIVTAELGQYGPMRRLLGIDCQATELGYSVNLSLVHEPETVHGEQALKDLLAWQVEGIIWAVTEIGNNRVWLHDKIPDLSVPVLFVSEEHDNPVSTVAVNNRLGGCMATEHLLAQGYRCIGIIAGPHKWHVARQRLLGWQDALSSTQPRQIVEGDWSAASGEQGLRQLLAQYPEVDAVFASNDQMALGALQAAHQLGLRVPEDLGVVGFDNTPESACYWPPLTTVRHQLAEQGKIAVQQLVNMIETQRQTGKIIKPKIMVLKPELIVRKSSLACPK
jgi:LacI family transcriptional regulator